MKPPPLPPTYGDIINAFRNDGSFHIGYALNGRAGSMIVSSIKNAKFNGYNKKNYSEISNSKFIIPSKIMINVGDGETKNINFQRKSHKTGFTTNQILNLSGVTSTGQSYGQKKYKIYKITQQGVKTKEIWDNNTKTIQNIIKQNFFGNGKLKLPTPQTNPGIIYVPSDSNDKISNLKTKGNSQIDGTIGIVDTIKVFEIDGLSGNVYERKTNAMLTDVIENISQVYNFNRLNAHKTFNLINKDYTKHKFYGNVLYVYKRSNKSFYETIKQLSPETKINTVVLVDAPTITKSGTLIIRFDGESKYVRYRNTYTPINFNDLDNLKLYMERKQHKYRHTNNYTEFLLQNIPPLKTTNGTFLEVMQTSDNINGKLITYEILQPVK